MDKNLKKRELMALGVHDLRNIARTVGVVGPTMKVKEQLIDEIIAIMSGEMQGNSGVKRGRKAKANFLTGEAIMSLPTELSEIFQVKQQKTHQVFGGNLGYLSLNQNPTSILIEYVDKQGFLLCENGEFYFFDDSQQKSMVYIPTQICENFDLKIGDKVQMKCKKMPGNNIFLGVDVYTINGCDAKKYKRNFCHFDELAQSSTKWFCDNVTEGDLTVATSKNVKSFLQEKKQLFDYCNNNNIFVVFAGLDSSLSEQEEIERTVKNGEVVHIYSDDAEHCFEMLVNAINNSIIRAQSGQKVLAVFFNFKQIYETLESLVKSASLTGADLKEVTDKIQTLNRILKNGGSVTTVVLNV